MSDAIVNLVSREILDSRGNPTVEVDVFLASGAFGRASVPSGASVGSFEALELRDGGSRYGGRGVRKSVAFVEGEILQALRGFDAFNQRGLDNLLIALDGTENKSRLGANTILGVSLAVAKAAANSIKVPLYTYIGGIGGRIMPIPQVNVINGGAHANNSLVFQEFMIVPVGFVSFSEAIRASAEVFHRLQFLLANAGYSRAVGDEGGVAPDIDSVDLVMDFLQQAVDDSGYSIGSDFVFAIDAAASSFYSDGKYNIGDGLLSSEELVDYYVDLTDRYEIVSLEDPMGENDHAGWKMLTDRVGKHIQVVGDDLFVTNCKMLQHGVANGLANAILIKLNQVGTLTETLDAISFAQNSGFGTIVSHRSGETEDTTIAHLAVASGCAQIKTGSMSRSDRLAKYNELLRIEERLGENAVYGRFNI